MASRKTTASLVIGGVILLGAFVMSHDLPGGPTTEMAGVVRGTALVPSDVGPSRQVATVALAKGGEIQARVLPGLFVHPGQTVQVRQYSGIIAGGKKYEISAEQGAK